MKFAKPNALPWLLVSALVVVLDQWSKAWVLRSLPEFADVEVIPGFWSWYRTYNRGAAFSFLENSGGWQIWLFSALAVIISVALIWALAGTQRRDWKTALPYALVIGGAIGNVIDRIQHGHVIDFIKWYVGDHVWPAFNLADSAIVGGAAGIILFGLFAGSRRENNKD